MFRYTFRFILCAATLLPLEACQPEDAKDAGAESPASARRPNIIVIVVDDLRWDELGIAGHPYLETPQIDRLAREGAWLTNAFHAVPLCSPNRASILTGQYPSRHGIIDNVARNRMSHRLETFPRVLQDEGYETGFLGKWHMGNDPTPRPGFDYWAAIPRVSAATFRRHGIWGATRRTSSLGVRTPCRLPPSWRTSRRCEER